MTLQRTDDIEPDSLLTSYQVGALLQVNPSSVNKWVKDGRITAFRTPGGHRRIRASDLVVFLDNHQMPVPKGLAKAAKRRVLLVDDEQRELDGLQRLLKPYNRYLEIKSVDNGIDALVLIGAYKPTLVVLDVMMPDVDGIEVCRRLQQRVETKGIRVVVASSQMNDDIAAKAKEAGATLALQKPIDGKQLLALLDIDVDDAMSAAGQ